jgi:two-component system, OmpR family, catabolic regulation response regulator CreB
MPPTLLLLEDDPAIARTVAYALQRDGFAVEHVLLVQQAAHRLAAPAHGISLAILDVGLPDGSGLDLCRELRRAGPALPIILLTARGEEIDRVLGLEIGADDYVTKPFSPRELCARVRALLRRVPASASASAAHEPLFHCDETAQRIRIGPTWLALTRREHGLLRRLLDSPGRIWTRQALLDAVWGASADSTDRTVDTHVKTLRAKLRDARPDLDLIATHRGMGYSLELPQPPQLPPRAQR